MTKQKNNISKRAPLLKSVLLIVISLVMLFLTRSIFNTVGDTLASNCPSYTEYGACVMSHGLRAGAGAAGVSGLWVLAAAYILIVGIYKFIKSLR